MKRSKTKSILIIMILFILLTTTILLTKINQNNFITNTKEQIYISEILPINKTVIQDIDNSYSDYIELYNDNDFEINLEGYYLSDETMSTKKWVFPKIIINPKEYLIVYASNKDKCELTIRECHTNFKLDKNGETITLLNSKGKVISKTKYPNATENSAYSLIEGEYKFTIPTPNAENINKESTTNNIKDVIINEVSSTNPEAIEIKNITNQDIDLSNYYIQDNSKTKYYFKNTIIKANSYLILYGDNSTNSNDKQVSLGFRINNNDEIIELYKNNQLIDKFTVGKTNNNISKGKNSNLETVIYKEKTFGKTNSKTEYIGFTEIPLFSKNDIYVEKGTKITLTSPDNSNIYYTLDGSIPTAKSTKYKEPITINKTTVIKAITHKEGFVESDIESRTYIVGRKHDLPVVSLSSDNSNLFGTNGILVKGNGASSIYPYFGANFWKDIEVPISFEYYEEGIIGLQFNAGMEIYGNWSRGEAQKSLDIVLRKEYGQSEITYPFFENNITTFGDLILRSSGQDYGVTKIKDAFLHKVLHGQMDIDKQDYKTVVVYINGKYYGLYNIREKTNIQYIENHHNAKNKNIDLIRDKKTLLEGSIDEYEKLLNYIKTNDMKTEEAYKYLDSQIDLQELINYWVVETYYGNTDPGNTKFYKVEDGKWRWILFDLDNSFYESPYNLVYTPTIRWNLPFTDYVPGHDYTINSTIMKNIIKNPKIREMYIKTWAQHLKTTFKPDRMNKILDRMAKDIETEIPYHIDRWYNESIYTSRFTIHSTNEWRNNIKNLKKVITDRYNYAQNHIKEGLGLTNEEYKKYFKK